MNTSPNIRAIALRPDDATLVGWLRSALADDVVTLLDRQVDLTGTYREGGRPVSEDGWW